MQEVICFLGVPLICYIFLRVIRIENKIMSRAIGELSNKMYELKCRIKVLEDKDKLDGN